MLISEVDVLLNNWTIGFNKVFKIKYSFANPDTLVILKKDENLFIVDKEKSTTSIFSEFNRDEVHKSISSGRLEYMSEANTYMSYKGIDAKGCECGAHKTTEPNCHAYWCPLHRRLW